jgi:2-keto-3-deoxy-L-fuconate dehydrogenase
MMNGTTPEMREKLRKRHPIGRLGVAEEQAAVALFLCSDAAGFMAGGAYPVDGGYLLN